MRRNKLYSANKWNQPAFMGGRNLFDGGGDLAVWNSRAQADKAANPWNYADDVDITQQYMNSTNFLGLAKKDNPFSKGNIAGGLGSMAKTSIGSAVLGAAGTMVGGAAYKGLSGGLNSGAGSAINSIGSTVGGVVSNFNPVLGAAVSAASGIIGGGVNALVGTKVDQEKLNRANEGTAAYNNFTSNAGSFDAVQGPVAQANVQNAYSGGVFKKGWARRRNAALRQERADARQFAFNSVDNNVSNIADDQMNDALANYAAFGGPLFGVGDDDMGAINYGFMQDYLTQKKQAAESKDKIGGITPMPAFMGTSFAEGSDIHIKPSHEGRLTELKKRTGKTEAELWAEGDSDTRKMITFARNARKWKKALGGDIQTNSADFSTGLMHIDAGGSHEENPYEGVQLGVDSEGVPNLVEEGETVFNDYVYSKRILCDEETKKMFHLPKKKDITFADLSKKLEKESSERPNDPISQAGLEAQMERLAEQQERQKQEMEAERAKAAFEALSPEEQTAIMQQRAAQEQAAIEQQAMAEQQAMQQPSPEEQAMAEQQAMMVDGSDAMLGEEPQLQACGGKINRYDDGGNKNVGTWKDDKQNHWDVFTKPGLRKYIDTIRQRLKMAPDEDTKNAIRKEAMNNLNGLQQSYFTHVLPGVGSDTYPYSEDILNHQKTFDRLYGNTGFFSKDENGNVRNLIADAINLPKGAATEDKPDNWFDGYSGPRTSIRNFGSTEYGDDKYYQDLVDEFKELGLTYAPNENWDYGDGRQLYALSMADAEPARKSAPKIWDWNTGDWIDKPADGNTGGAGNTGNSGGAEGNGGNGEGNGDVAPKHRAEWMRYAGFFGPAVGLGMQMAGIGKPDTASLDAAIEGAGDAYLAGYKPLGNYLRYNPMDIWYEQNALNAQSRATDRALANASGANRGTAMAGLIANGYNSQLASGDLYRKALEYNDAQRQRVADFNRGTDQFNAEAYNRTAQFNADALNRASQAAAQLRLQAASQKMDADAGWNQGIYGNVAGLFKGLSDLGRENAQWNMVSDMWADGLGGTATEKTNSARGHLKSGISSAKGGKIKRRKGLTF